jgi:hypothetical protein
VIANALFGDGAAAAVLQLGSASTVGVRLGPEHWISWAGRWTLWDSGSCSRAPCRNLSSSGLERRRGTLHLGIFQVARRDMFVIREVRRCAAPSRWRCACQTANSLSKDPCCGLIGNMSAPTVLFVLEKVLDRGLSGIAEALAPSICSGMTYILPNRRTNVSDKQRLR